ncbi:MAG TPA: serine hydrolase domain-containing protein [Trebonia sp.]|nr:serine hydrolase domain-containing protein [Trebonia sp.]
MAWREDAARSLTETFDGAFDCPGVVVAAACVDEAGAGIGVSPGDAPADGRFEIGSVTKTMTAALLALLADDGALSLDDEIGRWLSAGPNSGITLRQLGTHTYGLPRLAPNMDLSTVDPANPYAGFGFERAEEGLRQATAARGKTVAVLELRLPPARARARAGQRTVLSGAGHQAAARAAGDDLLRRRRRRSRNAASRSCQRRRGAALGSSAQRGRRRGDGR